MSLKISRARTFLVLTLCLVTHCILEAQPNPSRQVHQRISEATIATRLEAFARIDPSLFHRSTKIQTLVLETAVALRGDPRLVELVSRFKLPNQSKAILEIATGSFDDTIRDQAINLLLSHEQDNVSLRELGDSSSIRTLLARNGTSKALDLLIPQLQRLNSSQEEKRTLITILCSKRTSAESLYTKLSANEQSADKEIIQLALAALQQTPWNQLRAKYGLLAPKSSEADQSSSLIDLEALLTRSGSVDKGRQIFRAPEFTCVNCHVAEKVGNDFGPGLSEIGKKLGKDALYDAILNPSAGISFDYEGWNITLNSGDEITGIVLSRTETHWSVKNLLGQIQEIPIDDIFEKQKMSTSLMPSGLGALLGPEKLVDLVAYLSTLGK